MNVIWVTPVLVCGERCPRAADALLPQPVPTHRVIPARRAGWTVRAQPSSASRGDKIFSDIRRLATTLCPVNNKSARWAANKIVRQENRKNREAEQPSLVSVTEETNRISGIPRGSAGSRVRCKPDAHFDRRCHYCRGYLVVHAGHGAGHEVRWDGELWLIDRLTGSVYKCQAPERGKASCETEIATGAIGGERGKH
jgi:hypothetical protein